MFHSERRSDISRVNGHFIEYIRRAFHKNKVRPGQPEVNLKIW